MSLKRVNKEIEKIKTFKCNEHVRTFFDKLKFDIIFDEVNILQTELNHNACYCCNSLTCYTNWSPALTLMNVLLEYTEVAFIKKYSKWYNYIYLESIYSCLNINYFSKLPDEIIEIIFENLT